MGKHMKKVHKLRKEALQHIPVGVKVASGLGKGLRYKASLTQACDVCRRRVAFLNMGENRNKAFDVDKDNYVLGTHACDAFPTNQSVRAYRGGVVDSNRRRH